MGLIVKEKEIVVPGDELATGMDYLPGYGCYRAEDKIKANRLGLVHLDARAIRIVPLRGKYSPKRGDTIIGKVTDITLNGWILDINSAYHSMLQMRDATSEYIQKGADLTKYFNFDDYVVCKIVNVTSQKLIDVTTKGPGLRRLSGGRILSIVSSKVPRVIGKQGSMISMIKLATGCNVIVGQNGRIWLQGEAKNELIAVKAIRKIEAESHLSGLTERVKTFLETETKQKIKVGE